MEFYGLRNKVTGELATWDCESYSDAEGWIIEYTITWGQKYGQTIWMIGVKEHVERVRKLASPSRFSDFEWPTHGFGGDYNPEDVEVVKFTIGLETV